MKRLLVLALALACEEPGPPSHGPVESLVAPPEGLSSLEWGEFLFRDRGCVACHQINGVASVGPALDGVAGTIRHLDDGTTRVADEAYLRVAILEPETHVLLGYPDNMPSYSGLMDDAEVNALVAFLESL